MSKLFLFFIILFIVLIGIITSDSNVKFVDCVNDKNVCFYNGSKLDLYGYVASEVKEKNGKKEFILAYVVDKKSYFSNNRVLISIYYSKDLFYGDFLNINCNLSVPKNSNDSKFDYVRYLEMKRVHSVCEKAKITQIFDNKKRDFFYYIFSIRQFFMNKISSIYERPYDGFLAGILFGYSDLDRYLASLFSASGISHIIAISGYNISLIIAILSSMFLMLRINRFLIFYLLCVVLFVFTIFTGAAASVVRAFIMGVVSLLALQFGRKSSPVNLLFFVAFIMIIINPLILIYDIGFQLSFMATLGIVLMNPFLEKILSKFGDFFGLKESFITTCSAFLFTSPIIFINFGNFNILSILINVLVLFAVPLIMFFGFFSIVFLFIPFCGFISNICSFITFILMKYIVLTCEMFY